MADPGPLLTDPARRDRPTSAPRRRSASLRNGLVALGAALVLVTGCASGADDVVATGPDGSTAPTTTTSTSSTVPASTTSSSMVPPSSVTSTTAPSSTTTTTAATPATSVAPAVSVPTTDPALAALTTQVFWVRAPGDARVIDLPGYRDPSSGPLPLVVYGSVTNDGDGPIANPFVTATWLDGAGVAAGSYTAAVLEPGSTRPVASLAPGASADVILVVTDPSAATRLGALTPELAGGSRS